MNACAVVRETLARFTPRILSAATVAALIACGDSTGVADDNYDIEFDFSNVYQGWVAGFADYPVGKEVEWGIGSSLATLPSPLDVSRKGILLTGTNHSDDLFSAVQQLPPLGAEGDSRSTAIPLPIRPDSPKAKP